MHIIRVRVSVGGNYALYGIWIWKQNAINMGNVGLSVRETWDLPHERFGLRWKELW